MIISFKITGFLRAVTILVYIFVNAMFILKYGIRQDYCSPYLLLIFYLLFIISGLFIINHQRDFINKNRKFTQGFTCVSIVFFVLFVSVNFLIDANTLNTDRWSALELSIRSLLHLEYPYDKLDHLNQTPSYLPGMIYIGLPFYLFGDVGLLQPFVFLITMFTIVRSSLENYIKLAFMFLLIFSVAFLWEVTAKSDLMSNVMLTLLFMFYWHHKYKDDYFRSPIKLAVFTSFLVLTRGFVIIPLTIFLFKSFSREKMKVKIVFLLSLFFSLLLLTVPILISFSNQQTVIDHNPFFHQTAYAPHWLIIFFVTLPFFISLYIKNFYQVLKASFYLITILLLGLFIFNAFDEGWNANLYGGLFDISYLGITIPFVIFMYANTLVSLDQKDSSKRSKSHS